MFVCSDLRIFLPSKIDVAITPLAHVLNLPRHISPLPLSGKVVKGGPPGYGSRKGGRGGGGPVKSFNPSSSCVCVSSDLLLLQRRRRRQLTWKREGEEEAFVVAG